MNPAGEEFSEYNVRISSIVSAHELNSIGVSPHDVQMSFLKLMRNVDAEIAHAVYNWFVNVGDGMSDHWKIEHSDTVRFTSFGGFVKIIATALPTGKISAEVMMGFACVEHICETLDDLCYLICQLSFYTADSAIAYAVFVQEQ